MLMLLYFVVEKIEHVTSQFGLPVVDPHAITKSWNCNDILDNFRTATPVTGKLT